VAIVGEVIRFGRLDDQSHRVLLEVIRIPPRIAGCLRSIQGNQRLRFSNQKLLSGGHYAASVRSPPVLGHRTSPRPRTWDTSRKRKGEIRGTVYKKTATKPLPARAKIIVRKGQPLAE
jgi:hypothetical protein